MEKEKTEKKKEKFTTSQLELKARWRVVGTPAQTHTLARLRDEHTAQRCTLLSPFGHRAAHGKQRCVNRELGAAGEIWEIKGEV